MANKEEGEHLDKIKHFIRIFDWSSRIELILDVSFQLHRFELFDSVHVKFDV